MIQRKGNIFRVKRWLSIVFILTLLTLNIVTSLYAPSYASPSFGEDCQTCHSSGITISTNATTAVQIEPNSSFWLEVDATGGNPEEMMIVWSNVSHNPHFTFNPSEVEDNDPNDIQSDGGKISVLFKISSPSTDGNYILRTFAASSGGSGGFIDVDVTVGVGGVIAKPLFEIVMGWISTVTPIILGGLAIFGILLYLIAFRRTPGGVALW